MMLMPVIAHGLDLVEIARIEAMLDEHGGRFVQRCFTEGEQRYADAAERRRPERYAARFACKEAVLKALGTGWRDGISWCDIDIGREPSGRPTLRLTGRCAQIAAAQGITQWHVSLSHTDDLAIASVIASG